MHALTRPVVSNYAVPVLSVGAVLILGSWLDVYLYTAPVSLFICAVMFSAWFGGVQPGVLATILSILAFKYYFVPPVYSLVPETDEIPRLIVFSLATVFVGSLSARQRSATEALRESEQRFRDYAETASDWFWETGPDHAFTRVSDESRLTRLGIAAGAWIGTTQWAFASDAEEEPEKWRRHIATLDAHQPFRGLVYRTARADGSAIHTPRADGRYSAPTVASSATAVSPPTSRPRCAPSRSSRRSTRPRTSWPASRA